MKKQSKILTVSAVIAVVIICLVGTTLISQAAPKPQMARKIIVFEKETFVNEAAMNGLLKKFDVQTLKALPLVNGMAVYLPAGAEKALAEQTGILRIDNDDLVFALGKPFCNDNNICEQALGENQSCSDCMVSALGKPPCDYNGTCEPELGENQSCSDCKGEEEPLPPQPDEEMAWGVNRIDADLAWTSSKGAGIKVAIIDSGIDLDHPDLNVAGGYNAIKSHKSWDDDYGHGTHVAGIVAALDNDIGVIGTAPMVDLYAVKVLNRAGVGFASDIIEGLQWCIDNEIQVANMSIGSSGSSDAYHAAIAAAKAAGITIVAAAGNNGAYDGSIVWPARWPETIAVSATNENDGLAYFSSYGEEIDLAAPGQAINSTWNDGGYHIGSGTSMATPHVAGTAALILADPYLKCDTNSDGSCTPDEVQARLETTAEWLLELNSDQQGSGLVDAEAAVN